MTQEEFKHSIVFPHKNTLYRFALRMLGNKQEAEDTVQEVFLKLWELKTTLHHYRNPGGFAMTINKNICIDKLRRRAKIHKDVSEFQIEDNDEGPDVKIENENLVKKITILLKNLPEQQKMIFQLHDIEGYTYKEIAESLSLNVNTIRVNISRARSKIKESLVKIYSYEKKE